MLACFGRRRIIDKNEKILSGICTYAFGDGEYLAVP